MQSTRRPPPLPPRRELPYPSERVEARSLGPTSSATANEPERTMVRGRTPASPRAGKAVDGIEELTLPPPLPEQALARRRRASPPPTPVAAAKPASIPPALPASPGSTVLPASPGPTVPRASPAPTVPPASPGPTVSPASPGPTVPRASPASPASPGPTVPRASPAPTVPPASPALSSTPPPPARVPAAACPGSSAAPARKDVVVAAVAIQAATPPAIPTREKKVAELERKVEAAAAKLSREESSETRGREASELVEAAKSGDPRAFEALVKRYRHRIFALALHMTGSPSDADDITQDAFVRAYKNIQRFEGRSEFFTWLYRIALNRALNVRRDRSRRRTQDLDDPRVTVAVAVDSCGDPHRAMELRQTYGYLVKAFDRLSPLLKTTVALTMMQGLSYPEAAIVLETTEGTIAWRIHESRKQMRTALEHMMKDPTPVAALRAPDFERARARKATPRELPAFESPPALEMALALLAPSV